MRVALVLAAFVAVAAADPFWNVIAENLLTTCLGVAFESGSVGYLAGDANGAGPEILKTLDGGHTWNSTQANFGIDLLLLAAGAAENTVIVSSVFGELYSTDGKTFHQSIGGGLSQSVRYLGTNGDGGHKFGCAGTYRGKQGVALTTNSGHTFSPVFADVLFTEARYAAFPTDDVWYIAAGQFPNTNSSAEATARPRRSMYIDENGRYNPLPRREPSAANGDGYQAQIAKSSDGGKTWTSQFAVNNTIYMNGIDCTSATHCCAVGEAADSAAAGAYIYCTFDGNSWNQMFSAPYQQNEGFSLIDFRWANATLGWAVGGDLHPLAPKAWFVETKDGGKTWDASKHELEGYYTLGLDVVNEHIAYAAVDNLITQSSGLAKWVQL